ncbi:sugar ABC transporter, partial [Klebsiella michiganensis]
SEAYRQKGGGSFSRWQAHIRDWRRNLYRYGGVFPAVAEGDVLLLSPEPLDVVESELGYPPTKLSAAGLDNNPPQRVAYVLPRREAMLLAGRENVSMYEPMAGQLQSPTEIQPPSR